jgi:radical SAM superfamily enzyme YgiQ (UPF0313 family)
VGQYLCRDNKGLGGAKTKVLLVFPKVGAEAKNVSLYLPLSLLYVSSYLDGYSVAIYDQRVEDESVFDKLLKEGPICVGFSIMTGVQIKYALELAEKVRKRNIPTVFGGVHATILPEQTLEDPRVDYVVSGEGEAAFRELVEALEKKQKIGPILSRGEVDLDKASLLPFELVDIEQYVRSSALEGRSLPFLFSRGCPFQCTFCCNPVITKCHWRTMSLERAVELLGFIVDRFKLDGIAFMDENLMVNPRIANQLAQRINGRFTWFAQSRLNALLKYDLNYLESMGARRFSCGVESGSDRILKIINKEETVEEYVEVNRRLSRTGIHVWYNYIIGFPDETLEDLKMTVGLAVRMLAENPRANNNTFYLLTPYPGTKIASHERLKLQMPSTLEGWADFGRHNFTASWHSSDMLKIYSRICFSSKFVGRRVESAFPDDRELEAFRTTLFGKWETFDFYDDQEWEMITEKGWSILTRLFGKNAY